MVAFKTCFFQNDIIMISVGKNQCKLTSYHLYLPCKTPGDAIVGSPSVPRGHRHRGLFRIDTVLSWEASLQMRHCWHQTPSLEPRTPSGSEARGPFHDSLCLFPPGWGLWPHREAHQPD